MKRRNRKSSFEFLESRRLMAGDTIDDAYTMSEDTALIVGKMNGILANDIGVQAAVMGLMPEHGKLFLNKNGSFGYQPNPNFVGEDSFTYCETAGEDYAKVTITVNADTSGIDAVEDHYTTEMDTFFHADATTGLLANDVGVKKVASLVEKPKNGDVVVWADGSFNYTPKTGFYGTDTFVYRGVGRPRGADSAVVTISVAQPNMAPVAEDDFWQTNEDTTLVIPAPGVLWNDTDPNGDPLTVTLIDLPQNGSLTLEADGSFVYTPNENWWGSDYFYYSITDGEFIDYGTVAISVQPINDPPVAVADYMTMNEDQFLILDPILNNDIDVDAADYGSVLTMNIVGDPPQHGTLRMLDDQWIYEPDDNWYGTDSFTYEALDQDTASLPAVVTVQVLPVNDRPVVENDHYGMPEDIVLDVPVEHGVLRNDSDVEGDALAAVVIQEPEHGTLLLNRDGSFSYIPNPNYFGSDSFTYRAVDATDESFPATVMIEIAPVDDTPWVNDDVYDTDEDEVLIVEAPGVLGNDVDIDQETLIATLILPPQHGDLMFNADGSFAYTPEENWFGVDTFQYIALDETVETLIGLVTITVHPVNDPPMGRSEIYEMEKDTVLATTEVDGVLINETDADDDTLLVSYVDGEGHYGPHHGILFLASDGSFVYTPNTGFVGNDFFEYLIDDQHGGTAGAVAMITVTEPAEGNGLFRMAAFEDAQDTMVVAGNASSGLNRQNLSSLDSWFSELGKKKRVQAVGGGIFSDLDESDIDKFMGWLN